MSKLVLVPTPIGNLQDITLRALDVLKNARLILAEDTRKTSILLKHFEIDAPLAPFHKFNEHKVLNSIIQRIGSTGNTALVSDAGTPGISDPGFLLVRECIAHGIEVETLPGPTSFVPALVNSGLPCDRFVFEGFLPPKKGRNKRLETLAVEERTMVLFESPYRLLKTLEQLKSHCGENRKICVSRELTKIYEENVRGTISEVLSHFEQNKEVKGEIVIVVAGNG
jgi:16S rRNA (cytidine1402-2'-O)-methyltransferase